jgi:Ca2+-binding RTX toxin-like protein
MALLNGQNVSLTGDNVIDSLTNGYKWSLTANKTVNWSLSSGWNGEYWLYPDDTAITIGAALNLFSYYADIKFNYLGYFSSPLASNNNGADINFSLDGSGIYFNNSSSWATGLFPNPSDPQRGDIYLNLNSQANYLSSYAPGSAGFFLVIHEIGHALGLKHPHDDAGNGRPTFNTLGWSQFDTDFMTVMSYNDNYNWNLTAWDPATPMVLDVLALQYLYGKNNSTNATDTTYTLTRSGMYLTIWDAAGNDTIDQSVSNIGWNIYLPEIQLSSVVDTKVGFGASSVDIQLTTPTSLSWLTGDIENVKGSAYADTLHGNSLVNKLYGNAGNDILNSWAGNDLLNGGTGADVMLGGAGNDTYYVDNTLDKVYETTTSSSSTNAGGTDLVYSSVSFNLNAYTGVKFVEKLTLTDTANISATGNTLANTLTGNSGSNTLNGGAGKDILYGGYGADKFVFDTTLNSTTNLDTIKDFVKGTDKIVLDDNIFKAFSGKAGITSAQFKVVSTTSQLSGSGYLTYVTGNYTLYYDENGVGTGDVAFAKIELAGTAAPTYKDFLVIA